MLLEMLIASLTGLTQLAIDTKLIALLPVILFLATAGSNKEQRIFEHLKLYTEVHKGKDDKGRDRIQKIKPRIINKSPLPYGYKMIVSIPPSLSAEDFEKHKAVFSQFFDGDCNIRFLGNHKLEMEIITAKLESEYNYEALESDKPYKIPIGIGKKGVVWLKLIDSLSNILIGGEVGSGKSTLLRDICTYLISYLAPKFEGLINLNLVDLKFGMEFGIFKNSRYVKEYATDIIPAIELLQRLRHIITERGILYEKLGVKDIESYNEQYGEQLGYHAYEYCMIDELANLTDTGVKKLNNLAIDLLAYVGRTGRALGIRMIVATQRPDMKVVPGSIKNNYHVRICFLVSDSINSGIIIDSPGAEKLRGRGHGLIRTTELEEFQAYFIHEKKAEELIAFSIIDKSEQNIEIMEGVVPRDNFGA